MKEKDIKGEKVKSALLKRALGYDSKEVIEEYAKSEDGITLIKKKVTLKPVPPDVTALKLLLEYDADEVVNMDDEQLEKEKLRLLSELNLIKEKEETTCKQKKQRSKKDKSL